MGRLAPDRAPLMTLPIAPGVPLTHPTKPAGFAGIHLHTQTVLRGRRSS